MIYYKKSIPVEAFQLTLEGAQPSWFTEALKKGNVKLYDGGAIILTLEGEMKCEWGNYVIQGVKGELYPCRKDVFEETYIAGKPPEFSPYEKFLMISALQSQYHFTDKIVSYMAQKSDTYTCLSFSHVSTILHSLINKIECLTYKEK